MKYPIPESALSQHIAVLPAYKRDPRKILCFRECAHCGNDFPVAKKFPTARFCSRRCGLRATLPPDHNARVARATIRARAEKMRGRGEGKAYPKLNGRHAHRVVAEQKIGRALRPGEVVHHRDDNRLNYSPHNLEVLPSQSDHIRLHVPRRRMVTLAGITRSMQEWARIAGVTPETISNRIAAGQSAEQVIAPPHRGRHI